MANSHFMHFLGIEVSNWIHGDKNPFQNIRVRTITHVFFILS